LAALGNSRLVDEERIGATLVSVGADPISGQRQPAQAGSHSPLVDSDDCHHEPSANDAGKEVARMVAVGFTNREVAVELLISTRTVEAHVGHILNKLGLGCGFTWPIGHCAIRSSVESTSGSPDHGQRHAGRRCFGDTAPRHRNAGKRAGRPPNSGIRRPTVPHDGQAKGSTNFPLLMLTTTPLRTWS
jgi:hypothetical protein